MDYLTRPIDVLLFDSHFRDAHKLEGMTFVAFTQTERRWKATYQDGELSVTYEGEAAKTLSWLHGREATKE